MPSSIDGETTIENVSEQKPTTKSDNLRLPNELVSVSDVIAVLPADDRVLVWSFG